MRGRNRGREERERDVWTLEPGQRVHLSLVHPWRQAVDCYFGDDDADMSDLVWELPPVYTAGDLVVHIVPARGLAVLNVEEFSTGSDAEQWGVRDSAGAYLDGVSVRAIERRLGEPVPAAPATLDDAFALRFLDALDAEDRDPTSWQEVDTTGCVDHASEFPADAEASVCACCGRTVYGEDGQAATVSHRIVDDTDREIFFGCLAVSVCPGCHRRLHDLYGPSVAELMFQFRPPCPVCSAAQTYHLAWGMQPGPPPPGTVAAGCVITGPAPMPDYECGACGFAWSDHDEDGTGVLAPAPRPRTGARVRARIVGVPDTSELPSTLDRPGRLVVGHYRSELVESAWGLDLRHQVLGQDGHLYLVDPDTLRPCPDTPATVASTSLPMAIWMENTDRDWDALGEDVTVDRYRRNGTVAAASHVALQMRPGDIVMHWWSAPDHEQSLVGWSVVVGFPTLLDTTPHDSAPTGIRIEVPLRWQGELPTVVDLGAVRSRAKRVLAVADDLTHAADGEPVYFPFVRRGNSGIKGVSGHHLTHFPSELLDILPGLPSARALTNAASAELRAHAITDTVHDPRHAAALREHALAAAIRLLSADSYTVIDVSGFRGYELWATGSNGDSWQVHVVGSTDTDLDHIVFDFSTPESDADHSALIVVDGIETTYTRDTDTYTGDSPDAGDAEDVELAITARGGRIRVWMPWQLPLPPHVTPASYHVDLAPPTTEYDLSQRWPFPPDSTRAILQ